MTQLKDLITTNKLSQSKIEFRRLLERARIEKDLEKSMTEKFEELIAQSRALGNFLLIKQKHDVTDEFEKSEKKGLRERRRTEKLRRIRAVEKTKGETESLERFDLLESQPNSLKGGTLKPYQMEGLNWMISLYEIGANGILADQMGLGKTIQTIGFLAYLMERLPRKKNKFLIVAPTSVVGNWHRELRKWLPSMRSVRLNPRKETRGDTLDLYVRPQKFDVLITSYEAVSICKRHLKRIQWKYVIVDEAHRLKNEESKFSRSLRELTTEYKMLITGTPLQNNVHELWALLNFLMPDMFGDSDLFDRPVEASKRMSKDEKEEANLEFIQRLHHVLRPFILKRCKATLDLGLPEKKEIQLHIGMTDVQTEIYKKILLSEPINSEVSGYSNVLMQLRKVCNHPYLFEGVEPEDSDPFGEHLVEASGKLIVLDKLLKKLHGEHKVLIFSQFRSLLDILEDYLRIRKFGYCRFDGTTMQEDREHAIDEFRDPAKNKFVFLLSTRAGGLGINLTAADTVVLYDSDWNPQVDLQAIDRAHRIGQDREVRVYRLICEKTIEEKIIERQVVKMKWDQLVILKGKISQKQIDYGKEELKNLISYGSGDIFKSEGGGYKDEDIETLLARGEAKSKELESKVDKILEKTRDAVLELGVEAINVFDLAKKEMYDDEDRRIMEEKRMKNAYLNGRDSKDSQSRQRLGNASAENNSSQPRPKLLDFHYFSDRDRYADLLLIEKVDLTIGQTKEKSEIAARSFSNWTSFTFSQFLKAFENEENPDPTKLSKSLKKPETEVLRMISRFWNEIVFLDDHSKILERLYKGQEKRKAQAEMLNAIYEKARHVTDFEKIVLNSAYYNRVKNLTFPENLDKFLIFCSSKLSSFDGKAIQRQLRADSRFRYDFITRGLKSSLLSRRANTLARVCLNEIKTIMSNREAGQEVNRNREHFTRLGFAGGADPRFGIVNSNVRDLNEIFMQSNEMKKDLQEQRRLRLERGKKKKLCNKQFFMTEYLEKRQKYKEMLIRRKHRELALRKCGIIREITPMIHYEPTDEELQNHAEKSERHKTKYSRDKNLDFRKCDDSEKNQEENFNDGRSENVTNVGLGKRQFNQVFENEVKSNSFKDQEISNQDLAKKENIQKLMADNTSCPKSEIKRKKIEDNVNNEKKTRKEILNPSDEEISQKRSNIKTKQTENSLHYNNEILQSKKISELENQMPSNLEKNLENPISTRINQNNLGEIKQNKKIKIQNNSEKLEEIKNNSETSNEKEPQKTQKKETESNLEEEIQIEVANESKASTMISRDIDVDVLLWNPEYDEVAEREQHLRHEQLMKELKTLTEEMDKIHEYTKKSRETVDFSDPVAVARRRDIIYKKMVAFKNYMDKTDPERLLYPMENLCATRVNSPYYRLERNRQDDLEKKIFIHFLRECCNRIPGAESYIRGELRRRDLTYLVTQMMQCREVHQDNYLLEHVYSIRNQMFRRNYQRRCLRKLVEQRQQLGLSHHQNHFSSQYNSQKRPIETQNPQASQNDLILQRQAAQQADLHSQRKQRPAVQDPSTVLN